MKVLKMYHTNITHVTQSDITRVNYGVIMHGCNAQGVMGSGVAKQLRAVYPEIYEDYIAHLTKALSPRTALGTVSFSKINDRLIIANAITQEYYGRDGKKNVSYDALVSALESVYTMARKKCYPVNIPYLIGAGLGGGDFSIIESLIKCQAKGWTTYLHHLY